MSGKIGLNLLAGLVLAACSGSDESGDQAARSARDSAATPPGHDMAAMRDSAPAKSDSGKMSGMDHGRMNVAGSSSGQMRGMDHSGMAGMKPGAPGGRMPQMDHARMAGGATAVGGAMRGMDHSGMRMGARASASREAGGAAMPGMDHSAMQGAPKTGSTTGMGAMDHAGMTGMQGGMPGMQHGAAAMAGEDADAKLRALVAELVQDPAVRARIQADSVLRNRWNDARIRRILLNQP